MVQFGTKYLQICAPGNPFQVNISKGGTNFYQFGIKMMRLYYDKWVELNIMTEFLPKMKIFLKSRGLSIKILI